MPASAPPLVGSFLLLLVGVAVVVDVVVDVVEEKRARRVGVDAATNSIGSCIFL
jgi:hypothetical protein